MAPTTMKANHNELIFKPSTSFDGGDEEWKKLNTTPDDWSALDNIVWSNVIWYIVLHSFGLVYGLFLILAGHVKVATLLFAALCYILSMLSVTAGYHRLWSHRAYKARLATRIVLAVFNSMAFQNSIYVWARDHRGHHKFTDTDADHINIQRGFFFAHIGWLMCKKHPDVLAFGNRVDTKDLKADPVVYFQHRYYIQSVVIMCFLLPTIIPWYFWNESLWVAFVMAVFRYVVALHATWLVNSAAHVYGYRPYDVKITPVENSLVSQLTFGEGFHNYHHTFPWDYSVSEWGQKINLTTFVLDQLAKVGQVYDRRTTTREMIEARKKRTGPGAEYAAQEKNFD